ALDRVRYDGWPKPGIERDCSVHCVANLLLCGRCAGTEAEVVARLAELVPYLGVLWIAPRGLVKSLIHAASGIPHLRSARPVPTRPKNRRGQRIDCDQQALAWCKILIVGGGAKRVGAPERVLVGLPPQREINAP